MWCSLRGVGCSIKQRVRGARGPRSPKKSSSKGKGKGKEKESEVSGGEGSDEMMVEDAIEVNTGLSPKVRSG